MVAAVEFEIKRQIAAHEAGEALHQETRGWNEEKRETYLQRSKEEAHDYRYFPEPDLPVMTINDERLKINENSLPELPDKKIARYVKEFGLAKQTASQLAESRQLAEFFEKAVEYGGQKEVDPKAVANQIINNPLDIVGGTHEQIVDDLVGKRSNLITDEAQITAWCKEAITEDKDAVKKYKAGKTMVIGALVGLVMRKSEGKAEAGMVRQILEKLLK